MTAPGTSIRGSDTWRRHAVCNGVDTEVFYPFPANEKGIANALAFCRACPVPVVKACLAEALQLEDVEHGIRGGATPAQRRALLQLPPEERPATVTADPPKRRPPDRPPAPPGAARVPGLPAGVALQPCGTYAAFRRHVRADEDPCEPCREASRAHQRKARRKENAA